MKQKIKKYNMKKSKFTKRPKKVKINYEEIKTYIDSYTCSTYGITFKGYGIKKNITRFICECGQELIKDK